MAVAERRAQVEAQVETAEEEGEVERDAREDEEGKVALDRAGISSSLSPVSRRLIRRTAVSSPSSSWRTRP